jgi:peptide/nickel transport system permease protein
MGLVIDRGLDDRTQSYVAFARAHAFDPKDHGVIHLRNALIPIVTAAGLIVISLLTGASRRVTFGLPGYGRCSSSVTQRDLPVIRGSC